MRPADARDFAVALDKLFAFAQTFGLPVPNMTAAAGFIRSGMAHVPADLVSLAVDRAIADHRWGNRLPLPADLIGLIQVELDRRRATLIRLENIERHARRSRPIPSCPPESPEQREAAIAKLNEALAALPKPPKAEPIPAPKPVSGWRDAMAVLDVEGLRKIREECLG